MDAAQTGGFAWLGDLLAGRGDMVLMMLAAMFATTSLAKSFLEHGGGPYLRSLAERHAAEALRTRAEADLLTLQVIEMRQAPTLSERLDGLEKQWSTFSAETRGHVATIGRHVEEVAKMRHDPSYDRRGTR